MKEHKSNSIQGVFIDLDGVLFIENDVIEGALETIQWLKTHSFPCRFMTNTTVTSLNKLHQKLLSVDFDIKKEEIISPLALAAHFLRHQGNPACYFVIKDEAREDFAGIKETDSNPDYIVVGKIGNKWDYDLVNRLFRMMVHGSQLIALHKNKYSMSSNGLDIEFGAFIAALEYATGQTASIFGKPSTDFFQRALKDINLNAEQVAMIGDDIESDIGGAQRAGLKGFLVKTGKYNESLLAKSAIQPDGMLNSIEDLPNLLMK